MKLTPAEETLMQHLWTAKKAFMKELLDAYDAPKPAATTVATLLKRMIGKGFVSYREYGNSREYSPKISRNDYFSRHVNGLIKNFFNDSAAQFASFFTTEANLSTAELEALKTLIDEQLKKQKP